MKGLLKSSGWLVMAAALSFGIASCSSDDDAVGEQQSVNPSGKYTMTVQVTKGDADTRALRLGTDSQDKPVVDAYWSGNEKIDVVSFVGEQLKVIGTATAAASSNGATTLTATLTDAPSKHIYFYLGGHDMTWTGQVGLLTGTNSISEKYDYAIGGLRSYDYEIVGSNIIPNEYASVEFLPQQAIVKFTLVDKANGKPINATSLTFHCGDQSRLFQSYNPMTGQVVSGNVTITPSGTTNVIYASLAQVSDCPLTLTATVGDDTYIYDKDKVSFTHGTYNEVTVKMEKATVTDLSKLKAENLTQNENGYYEYVAKDGEILTGKLNEIVKISIAKGAKVTLDNVTIDVVHDDDINNIDYVWGGITCEDDATIILKGANTVKGFYRIYPGIHVLEGSTLTIEGTGSLDASSNGFGAGIGGGYGVYCGNIVIKGGTITATGGDYCAGIGSGGDDSSCESITINGGTIKATGGFDAAGIGSGGSNGYIEIYDEEGTVVDYEFASSCGAITINGGTITAKGGDYAAGIGSGAYSLCESITIENTVTRVTAEKGYGATDFDCIGVGDNGNCAEVVIGGEIGYIEESPYTYVPASGGQGEDTD